MKKRKMPNATKIVLVIGLVMFIAGMGLWAYNTFFGGDFGEDDIEYTVPVATVPEVEPATIDKVYTPYYLPDDAGSAIVDEYLNYTLLDAGRVSDNAAVEDILSTLVDPNGYYFTMKMTYDGTDEYCGLVPFAYLNGRVDGQVIVSAVRLYACNTDMTEIKNFDFTTVTPGCEYTVIAYAEYDVIDDAQIQFYNNGYDIAIVHMSADCETVVPSGYSMRTIDGEIIPAETEAVTNDATDGAE